MTILKTIGDDGDGDDEIDDRRNVAGDEEMEKSDDDDEIEDTENVNDNIKDGDEETEDTADGD